MQAFLSFVLLAVGVVAQAPVNQLTGYGASTTGGGNASPTQVSTCSALEAALGATGPAVVTFSGTLSACGIIDIESDKTVLGVGSNAKITGGGFRVRRAGNVIIRNILFDTAVKKGDLVALDNAKNVWIDHNEFASIGLVGGKDDYDGLLDISHASDGVTVSWNKFRNHWKGSLIGHSDNNADEDTGTLHVTYHHNLWTNVNSRTPSVRFGVAHIYNSIYQDSATSGINSRMGAQVLVESNVFNNFNLAIVTNLDSDLEGFAVEKNNVFNNSTTRITKVGSLSPPYSYKIDSTSNLASILAASAGVGKI